MAPGDGVSGRHVYLTGGEYQDSIRRVNMISDHLDRSLLCKGVVF